VGDNRLGAVLKGSRAWPEAPHYNRWQLLPGMPYNIVDTFLGSSRWSAFGVQNY